MKKTLKQILSFLLVIAMVCTMIPAVFAAGNGSESADIAITKEAEEIVNADIWDAIDALEAKEILPTRADPVDVEDYAALSEQVEELVLQSDTYVEGSLVRNGEDNAFFTWVTTEGIVCGYSPEVRYRTRNVDEAEMTAENITTESYAVRGGSPSSKKVYLISPYYNDTQSADSSFTDQYKKEGQSIAAGLGGTFTQYGYTAATITNIATAMMNGAVVLFDSHGTTDYANGNDYVSRANTSYLCLKSGTGITSADMAAVSGTYGTYYHAFNSGGTYCVDGTAIANHMTSNAPGTLLWMAICLGMATSGLNAPMRAKGVEVVYGYSQSVSFTGDYKYEASFWDSMLEGKTVAQAMSTMKSKYGNWDPAYSSYSQSNAVKNYVAFPIVVSDEDAYPGQGKVDAVQTVKSTYTLFGGSSGSDSGDSGDSGDTGDTGTPITISFSCPEGVSASAVKTTAGTAFTLPTPSGSPTANAYSYKFAGWVTSSVSDTTTKPTIYTAGQSVSAQSSLTLYAVYTYTSGSKTYYTTNLKNAAAAASITISFSCPEGVSASAIKTTAGTSFTLPTPNGTPTANAYSYKFAGWVTSAVSDTTTKPTIYTAGQSVSAQSSLTLYAVYTYTSGSRTYYTTKLQNASSDSGNDSGTDATAITISFSCPAGVSASAIQTTAGTNFTLPTPTGTPTANAYSYKFAGWVTSAVSDTTTKPTIYAAGNSVYANSSLTLYALYTYTSGSRTYYTTKLQNASSDSGSTSTSSITISFSCPEGVSASAIKTTAGTAFTLPSPTGTPTANAYSYKFAGWVTAKVSDTTTKPTIYTAGKSVSAQSSLTLYAVYTYTSGYYTYYTTNLKAGTTDTTTDNQMSLVSSASALGNDTYIFVVKGADGNYMLQNTKDGSYAAFAAADAGFTTAPQTITTNSKAVWTVTYSNGKLTIKDSSGKYLYASSSSSGVSLTASSSSCTWTPTFNSDGTFSLKSSSGYYLSLRDDLSAVGSNGNPVFCISGSQDVGSCSFYLYRDNMPKSICRHTFETVTVEATAAEGGYTTYTCTTCGETFNADDVLPTGDGDVYESTAATTTVYLKPNSNWTKDGARFAIYFFGAGELWVGMEDTDNDGVYEATMPEGAYTNMIFCRMNPSTTANNWNNKWNQTADLAIPTDGSNLYTVKNGTWDAGGGTWSVFEGTVEPEPEIIPPAAGTVLYFMPGSQWGSDDARYAAYFFGAGDAWVSMNDSDGDGYYEAQIPAGGYTNVIFCRMDGTTTENSWDNKFNQTIDLVLDENYNCFNMDEATQWDTAADGTWSVYTPAETPEFEENFYLVGYINGANYGCEEDYANMGEYKFVDGTLTVTFDLDSYVFIKKEGNVAWYMTKEYAQENSAVFYNTSVETDAMEKMMVPAGEVTFTLVENEDGSLTLSYVTAQEEGPIPTEDLKFINKSLSLQSYIAFNVLASKSTLFNYDSWYVVFERYDYEFNEVVTKTVEGTVYMNNYWQFEYKLNSYHMTDTVTATLYAVKDGKTYVGETYVNSAADYVIGSLPKATNDAHRKVFADLLTYGAKAQTYMGYNVEKLADANLGEYASFVTTTDPTAESIFAQTDKGLTGVTLGRMALGIASSVELQAILKVSSGYKVYELYAEMAYVSGGKTMTQRIEGEEFQIVGGGIYVAVFNALTATDGRTPVEITVYDAEGNAVSETWTYSIASYLDGTALTGDALNTLYALINFYDSAAAYYNG